MAETHAFLPARSPRAGSVALRSLGVSFVTYDHLTPPATARLIAPHPALGPGCKPAALPSPLGACPVPSRPRQDTIRGRSRRRRADPHHGNHGITGAQRVLASRGLSSRCCVLGSLPGAARHPRTGGGPGAPEEPQARHVLASKMTLCSRARRRDWRLGPRRRPFGRYKTSALSVTDCPCQTLFVYL